MGKHAIEGVGDVVGVVAAGPTSDDPPRRRPRPSELSRAAAVGERERTHTTTKRWGPKAGLLLDIVGTPRAP